MKRSYVCVIGTNHRYAPQDVRERLAIGDEQIEAALKTLKSMKGVKEVMILSTCNRIEIISVLVEPVEERIVEFMSSYSSLPAEKLKEILYIKRDMEAVRHIFRVASSLDSMVLGEPQILGQLKEAYKWSVEFMTSGATINRIMRRAFHAAKAVKSRTGISKGAVSIPYAAVMKAKSLMDLEGRVLMSVGSGEMNRLTCEHFAECGVRIRYVASRTIENAKKLASAYGAQALTLQEIGDYISDVDIVVSSTGSKEPVITKEVLKNSRPLIIDLAVPRDTEPSLEKDNRIILLDDLKSIIEEALTFRKQQAKEAEKIIDSELKAYEEYVASLDYDEVVKRLRLMAEDIRRREIARFRKSYADRIDDDVMEGVDRLTRAIINKVLHEPTVNIKLFMEHPEGDMYIELLKRIFKIEHSKKDIRCFFSENS